MYIIEVKINNWEETLSIDQEKIVAMQDRIAMISKIFTKSTGFGDRPYWLEVVYDTVGVRGEEGTDLKFCLFNWMLFIVTEKME